jgi:hypothetical protein
MTNQATEILTELRRRGVLATADGGDICLKPKRALDDALRARIREAKPAILEALRNAEVLSLPTVVVPPSVPAQTK